jgi:hypothetical protein
MTIMKSPRRYAHILTLEAINEQLRAPNKELEERFMCIGYRDEDDHRCVVTAKDFPNSRPILSQEISDLLDKPQVSDEDFVKIARSLFCPRDDGAKWGGFNAHLRWLWTAADTETQNGFLEAIKQGHKEISIHYLEAVKRSRSEKAEEHSSKGETAGDDASPATPNGNRHKDRFAVDGSKQHSLPKQLHEVSSRNMMTRTFHELISGAGRRLKRHQSRTRPARTTATSPTSGTAIFPAHLQLPWDPHRKLPSMPTVSRFSPIVRYCK